MKIGFFSFGRAVLISVVVVHAAAAQTVDFRNTVSFVTPADRRVYGPNMQPLVGTNFVARLLYGIDAASLQPVNAAPVRFRDIPPTDSLAGTWVGGTRTLTGFSPGQTVTMVVQVWDSASGATYETATARGQSAPFTYTIPPAGSQATAYYIENFRGFGPLSPQPGGTVMFENQLLPSPPERRVFDVHGNPLVGTNYLAQLYYGASPAALVATTTMPARFASTNAPTNLHGMWMGGTRTLSGFGPGQTVYMQVRVWDSLHVSSYGAATQDTTGGQYGRSEIFAYVVPPAGSPPTDYYIDGFRSFMLVTNPPDRVLVIRENGERIDLMMKGAHTIQGADSLAGPWNTLYSGDAPYTDAAAATNRQRFYRMYDEPGPTYSLNAVGYYRVDVCAGFSLIANQLNAHGGNTVTNLLRSSLARSDVYKFNPVTGGYVVLANFGAWEGDDLEMSLSPGEGAFLYSPAAQTLRFLGEVPLNGSVPIPSGFSLISSPFPRAGTLDQPPPGGLGFPSFDGLCIYQWDSCGAGGYDSNCFYVSGWEGDSGGSAPIPGLGEAFWVHNPGPARVWNGTHCLTCP